VYTIYVTSSNKLKYPQIIFLYYNKITKTIKALWPNKKNVYNIYRKCSYVLNNELSNFLKNVADAAHEPSTADLYCVYLKKPNNSILYYIKTTYKVSKIVIYIINL